jgi:hypothetical protein
MTPSEKDLFENMDAYDQMMYLKAKEANVPSVAECFIMGMFSNGRSSPQVTMQKAFNAVTGLFMSEEGINAAKANLQYPESYSDPEYSASFDWCRSQSDVDLQEEVINQNMMGEAEKAYRPFVNFVGELIGDIPLFLATSGVVGGITKSAKTAYSIVGKALEASWKGTTPEILTYVETISASAAKVTHPVIKNIASRALKDGTNMAVFSYVNDKETEYIGIPVEDIGAHTGINFLVGAMFGTALEGASASLKALKSKRIKLVQDTLTEKVTYDWEDSDVSIGNALTVDGHKVDFPIAYERAELSENASQEFPKIFNVFPIVKGLNSPFDFVRIMSVGFFENQFTNLKERISNIAGLELTTPVQTEMKINVGRKLRYMNTATKHTTDFINAGYGTKEDFYRAQALAMVSGDESPNHIVSGFVTNARKMINEVLDEAVKAGVFEDIPVIEDRSYYTRIFNIDYINENDVQWMNTLQSYYEETLGLNREQAFLVAKHIDATVKGVGVKDIPTFAKVQEALDETSIDEILKIKPKRSGAKMQAKQKPTKERTLNIQSLNIFDFLDHDPYRMANIYFDGMNFEIAQKRILTEIGTKVRGRPFKNYQEVISWFTMSGKGPITPEKKEAIEFLTQIPKIVSGQMSRELKTNFGSMGLNKAVDRGIVVLETLNYLTKLGTLPFSYIEDLALSPTFKHIANITNMYIRQNMPIDKETMRLLGIGCNTMLGNSRVLTMPNKLNTVQKWFDKLIFANQFDDIRALATSTGYTYDMCKSILAGEIPERSQLTRAAVRRISNAIKRHSTIASDGTVEDLNIADWPLDARRDFASELHRRTSKEVIRPQNPDIPLHARTTVGRFFNLFMGYQYALTTNVLLPMFKERLYGEGVNLLIKGFALSYLRTYVQSVVQNNPYDLDDPKLITDAIRRMPLGIFSTPLDVVMSFSSGEKKLYSARDIAYSAFSGGNATYILQMIDAIKSAEKMFSADSVVTTRDVRNWIGLIPGNNLIQLRPVLDFFVIPNLDVKQSPTRKERHAKAKMKSKVKDLIDKAA